MWTKETVDVVAIVWEGPFQFEELRKSNKGDGFGIYQIYGTHAVGGPNSLLYIGRATKDTLKNCITATRHKEWIDWEAGGATIYLGRIAVPKTPEIDEQTSEKMIERSEALLIYYCTPAYNSNLIKKLAKYEPTVLLNYKSCFRLPFVVSNLLDQETVYSAL